MGEFVAIGIVGVLVPRIAVLASTAFSKLRGNLDVGEVDAAHLVDCAGIALSRIDGVHIVRIVDLVCDGSQILHFHIGGQGVELRGARLVAVAQVHGQGHPKLLREQLAQLDRSIGIQSLHGFALPLLNALLETSPTRHRHVGGHADIRQVCQSGVRLGDRRPTPFFIESREPQLVHPHLRALGLPIVRSP